MQRLLRQVCFDDYKAKPKKTWQEVQVGHRLVCQADRPSVFEESISFKPHQERACEKCFSSCTLVNESVRCLTCVKHMCWQCDYERHSTDPFHRRLYVTKLVNEPMEPSLFFDINWTPKSKGYFHFKVLIKVDLCSLCLLWFLLRCVPALFSTKFM